MNHSTSPSSIASVLQSVPACRSPSATLRVAVADPLPTINRNWLRPRDGRS